MTPQELKNSILQLAIQGKLVEQRPEEGTAEELIQTAGFHESDIEKDEYPFEIPESWKWMRHNDFFEIVGGSQPPKAKFVETPQDGYIRLYQIRDYGEKPVPVYVPIGSVSKFSKKGDILLARYGGSLGKVFWAQDGAYNVAMAKVVFLHNHSLVYPKYLFYFYLAPPYQMLVRGNSRSAQAGFNKEDLQALLVPLPPLAEQKRIVAKIEELLPLIDRYEKAWSRLEDFNKRFPADMQKSLLQLAIQGKLVEQRPEEGTGEELYEQIQAEKQKLIKEGKIKKEKPLPKITEDEIPFEIPENWKWTHFNDVIDVRDGTHDTPKYVLNGVPLVTSKNLVEGSIQFENTKEISLEDAAAINMRSEVGDGDILFAMIGTIGNPVLVKKDREFCIKNMALFKALGQGLVYMPYVLLFLQCEQDSMKRKASGGVQSFVSLRFLREYLFPLPPIDEQMRIVDKYNKLHPLCERLLR